MDVEFVMNLEAWATNALAFMNVPPPEPTPGDAPVGGPGFGAALGQALSRLGAAIWAAVVAAPAIASMLLLLAGTRWPRFGRSVLWNAVAAIFLTLAIVFVLLYVLNFFDLSIGHLQLAGYASYGVVAVAIGLQFAARRSFSPGRAAGLAGAVLIIPALELLSPLWS